MPALSHPTTARAKTARTGRRRTIRPTRNLQWWPLPRAAVSAGRRALGAQDFSVLRSPILNAPARREYLRLPP
jgi:hypothetical protein